MSFSGIVFLALKEKLLHKILIWLIALACGAMLGGAFLHLLPEAVESGINIMHIGLLFIAGILVFFILEKFLHWRHCHDEKCKVHADVHPVAYLNLIGDGLHNFMDGMIIAAAYLVNLQLGIATTFAVIVHEIPQEIGDFGVLIYAGLKKKKALFLNFLSALVAVVGALVAYFMHDSLNTAFLLPFAAGGFIYIAATDLIPELHKKSKASESILQFIFIVIGLALMWLLKFII
jgi:zinc and cadmium transporter